MIKNLLGLALGVLPKQTALLYRWRERQSNAAGFEQDSFAAPLSITASIQPVDRTRYEYYGLDTERSYITIHAAWAVESLGLGRNPDQIEWNGRRYETMGRADWRQTADFTGLMAVDIGPAQGEEVVSLSENSLWQTLLALAETGLCRELDARGRPNPFYVPGLALRRAYQPTTQARTGGPELLLHRTSSRRYGAQGTRQEWEPGSGTMYEYMEWLKEDNFQATAVAATDAADASAATEKDILELFGGYMQSPAACMPLAAAGIGILRVTDVQETPYQDEQGHHRMSVYILFTLSYPQFIRREIPVATSIEHKVFRV